MSNKDRKRKKYQYSLSDATNDQITKLSEARHINKSRLVEEAIKFYTDNYVMPNTEEAKDVMPTTSEIEVWDLEQLNVMPVDTNNTEYTLQETEEAMKFKDFSDLMAQDKKYEIKGAKLVLKEEYKEQEDAKVNAPITTMSELIKQAQDQGLSLKH